MLFIEALLMVVKTLEAKSGRWLSRGMALHVKKLVAKSDGLSSIPGAPHCERREQIPVSFL